MLVELPKVLPTLAPTMALLSIPYSVMRAHCSTWNEPSRGPHSNPCRRFHMRPRQAPYRPHLARRLTHKIARRLAIDVIA